MDSWLSMRVRSRRSVMRWARRSVSFLSCAAKRRAWSGSSSSVSSRLSASSFRLVAGVLSSWETLATKSRRILLTLCSSSGLTCGASLCLSSVTALLRAFRQRSGGVLWLRLETVAEAPRRVDVLVGGFLLQGGPYPAYVHVNGTGGADAGVPPDLLGEILATPELAGGRGEGGEELELLEAQLERLSTRTNREVLGVELQVSGLDYLAPANRLAALEVRVDAGDELLHAEGLRHVIVGPGFEPAHLVFLGVLGRDHHDHHALVALADPLAYLYPGLAGKHDVEQDQVWPQLPRQPERVGAAGRLAHPEAIAGEVVGKGTHDYLVVLDYQDLRRTGYQSTTPVGSGHRLRQV